MDLTTLTPELLESLSPQQLQELNGLIEPYKEYQKYHRIEYFNPYPYQREFMNAGKDYLIRYLRAGNRTGKTFGAATEFAYHITGRYPDWWEGAKIQGSGHTFWAVGITLDSVATVIQKELFGVADIRAPDVGSGTIPKECINFDTAFNKDGDKLKSCQIKHVNGGYNTLRFYSSENTAVMMGARCALIWMDEEALNGMEVYSQCKTRLINAFGPGKNGLLMITATPERGNTELNQLFDNDETGLLYIKSASWYDCPNFTPEQIEKELSTIPAWQREMRSMGIPVIGTGAIFPYADEDITVNSVNPRAHWQAVIALDWGVSVDATVIAVMIHNPDADIYYLYDLIYCDASDYDRSPANVADIINNSPYAGLPVIRPHDHPALSNQLRDLGVNVQIPPASNPPASQLRVKRASTDSRGAQDIQTGIDEMNYLLSEGRLKIMAHCYKWFEEKRTYYYRLIKSSGKLERTKPDHAIDASRYALMALMSNRGADWATANNMDFNSDSDDYAIELYL